MILDTDIYLLIDDVQSIATATAKLADLSRNMAADNPELGDYQKDAINQLRTLEAYSQDVRRKCQALLASVTEGAMLSPQEMAILKNLNEAQHD